MPVVFSPPIGCPFKTHCIVGLGACIVILDGLNGDHGLPSSVSYVLTAHSISSLTNMDRLGACSEKLGNSQIRSIFKRINECKLCNYQPTRCLVNHKKYCVDG